MWVACSNLENGPQYNLYDSPTIPSPAIPTNASDVYFARDSLGSWKYRIGENSSWYYIGC